MFKLILFSAVFCLHVSDHFSYGQIQALQKVAPSNEDGGPVPGNPLSTSRLVSAISMYTVKYLNRISRL